ncbi:MAG: radical SAM protein, partial [Thermodesulfobacteriota bacterium]
GYEGNEFGFSGNIEEDLLSITSVHPMREASVKEYLRRAETDWSLITDLIKRGVLKRVTYQGTNFYLRKFSQKE